MEKAWPAACMCYCCIYIMQSGKQWRNPKLFLPEFWLTENTEEIPTLPMKLLLVSSLALILTVSGSGTISLSQDLPTEVISDSPSVCCWTVEAWRRPRTLTQSKTQQWCVASEDATDAALQEALDWACSSQGGADCTLIQSEGACFLPNTLKDHASFAFNDYWQKFKGQGGTCDFKGSALLVDADPSTTIILFSRSDQIQLSSYNN